MARPNGIDNMSYHALVDLKQRVAAAIVERTATEKAEIKRRMAELAAASGFDLSELIGGMRTRKGAKVEAKYRNPTDPGQTWAGRGRQPRWLVAALKKGQKLESFAI
jgi:DNA-binding protein H-NS